MPNLYFEYYAVDYRGVCIDTDFADDEVMVSIPSNLLITVERAKESPIGQAIIKSACRLRSHAFVACFLLEEKLNPNSYFKPYIDILPKSYRSSSCCWFSWSTHHARTHVVRCIPTQFTAEELDYLRGSLTLEVLPIPLFFFLLQRYFFLIVF